MRKVNMDEENKEEETEEKKPEVTAPAEDEGSKPTTTPLIDIANAAAKRMEDANKETARLQKVQADRDARITLGGEGGGGQPQKSKEELKQEEAQKSADEMVNAFK